MPVLTTWNLQGSNASTENKWNTGIFNLLGTVPIVCVQECGGQPRSAVIATPALAGNANYVLYRVGTGRNSTYISHYLWDVAGNRCNLAIVSKTQPAAWACPVPAGGPVWRPVIGAQIAGTWYFCLHAISPGGADGAGLLLAAAGAAGATPWYAAGDFNRSSTLPPHPTGNICVANGNTYKAPSPANRYDYMYSSVAAIQGAVIDLYMSDHYPVQY